jgi:hypothetical protein
MVTSSGVNYEVQGVFQGLQKQHRSYIHNQFSGKAEQTLLSCYLYSQHKKTILGHTQKWLPGTLKSNSKTMRKIVIRYLFLPYEIM